jgi:hypothetical protein
MRTTLAVAAVTSLLVSCSVDATENDVIARAASPDGAGEAVLAEFHGGGPAVGVSADVYVHAVGAPIKYADRVFHSECASHITMRWRDTHTLTVTYDIGQRSGDDLGDPGPWWRLRKPAVAVQRERHTHPGDCFAR